MNQDFSILKPTSIFSCVTWVRNSALEIKYFGFMNHWLIPREHSDVSHHSFLAHLNYTLFFPPFYPLQYTLAFSQLECNQETKPVLSWIKCSKECSLSLLPWRIYSQKFWLLNSVIFTLIFHVLVSLHNAWVNERKLGGELANTAWPSYLQPLPIKDEMAYILKTSVFMTYTLL